MVCILNDRYISSHGKQYKRRLKWGELCLFSRVNQGQREYQNTRINKSHIIKSGMFNPIGARLGCGQPRFLFTGIVGWA